jgi:N-acetylmuramoyl-L-alanine amidase
LGLKITTRASGQQIVLSDGTRRLELEADSRECLVNGVRVFLGAPVANVRGQLSMGQIDFDTCLLPILEPSKIGSLPPRPKIVALDPGHGGNDQGTQNIRLNLSEKNFTLDVASRLKRLLEQRGFRVVMTRETDTKVELPLRSAAANRAGADLFVSIHFNALPNDQKTRGTEIFTFAPQYQRSTNSWSPAAPDDSERERSPVNRFDPWSSVLAHGVHRELLSQLKTFDRGKKIAHLGMLRGLECPAVLVESGFLSNDEEARKISTAAYRQKIAEAMADGVSDYAKLVESLGRK